MDFKIDAADSVKTSSCRDNCHLKADNSATKVDSNLEPKKRVRNKLRDLSLYPKDHAVSFYCERQLVDLQKLNGSYPRESLN